jgi:hypothetical protein
MSKPGRDSILRINRKGLIGHEDVKTAMMDNHVLNREDVVFGAKRTPCRLVEAGYAAKLASDIVMPHPMLDEEWARGSGYYLTTITKQVILLLA